MGFLYDPLHTHNSDEKNNNSESEEGKTAEKKNVPAT